LSVSQVDSSSVAKNLVVSQSPASGTSAKSGATIDVKVSEGPGIVTLPKNLLGRGCAGAVNELRTLHVIATCPAANEINSSRPAGEVAQVLYGKTANPLVVPRGSSVILELSNGSSSTSTSTASTTTTLAGEGLRAMPNVVGDDYAQAYAAMKKAVLYFSTTGPGAGTTTWTKVISQSPAAGTMVPYKSTVTLDVQ
jgi:beta-lactam-binding protein with PASTA domain